MDGGQQARARARRPWDWNQRLQNPLHCALVKRRGQASIYPHHPHPPPPPPSVGLTGKTSCSLGSETEPSHDHADGSLCGPRNSCFSRDIPEQPLPPRGSAEVRPSLLHAGIPSSRLFSDLVQVSRCLHWSVARRLSTLPADAPPLGSSITRRTDPRTTAS